MLRALDQAGGVEVYTRNLVDHLLAVDPRNEYVLLHRSGRHLDRYRDRPNASQVIVPAPDTFTWDQIAVPLAAYRARANVLFHTKFTVPLAAPCPTAMTLHGSAWFTHPELFGRADIAYVRAAMPVYCRRAAALFANSDVTARDFVERVGVPASRIHTTHLAADRRFAPVEDPAVVARARRRYGLPDRFILTVARHDPRKNVPALVDAFARLRARVPSRLLVVGLGVERYREELRLAGTPLDADVQLLGWVDQADLPAIYAAATVFVLPSVYEAFGIPVCEAMACGAPVVASRTGALPEVAGDAAIYVDPGDPAGMADALHRVWTDPELRASLRARGLARSSAFSWRRCARETLAVIETLAPRRYSGGRSVSAGSDAGVREPIGSAGSTASPTSQTS